MTMFQYINDNLDIIKKEIRMGLISTKILNHYTIYSKFDYYRKLGNYVGVSVCYVSEDYDMSKRQIYKIIQEMEMEV